MKSFIYTSFENYRISFLKAAFAALFLVLIGASAFAQDTSADKSITGVVRFSEDNEGAPGVNIYLKGSTATGTYSGPDGQFKFPLSLKSGDVLVFSFIGRKTSEYVVTDPITGAIEIVMAPDLIEMVEDVLVEGECSRPSPIARLSGKAKNR